MKQPLRIVLAQLNLIVGDIEGNLRKHLHAIEEARTRLDADVIVFPELSLTGYPSEDLLLRPAYLQAAQTALLQLQQHVGEIHCVVGHPHHDGQHLYNACSVIHAGKILARYDKQELPNYGVFDEARYFTPGKKACVVTIKDTPVGIIICEDIWKVNPLKQAVKAGAKLVLIPNASPFEQDKHERRVALLTKRAQHHHTPLVYVNQIGGQDELVFDGGSLAVNAHGDITHCAGFFQENLSLVDMAPTSTPPAPITTPSSLERIYQALVLGVKDYIEKNHFTGVLVGLSGGIDSALTLAIAVDALGKDRVRGVLMPSRFTLDISNEDALALANNLGVLTETISIEPAYQTFLTSLTPSFEGKKTDVTEENIQARCRGVLLMALSNKYGHLVLSTGNRSELAVGYCTLYGDMAGGFAVLKDVPKTRVYELSRYRNHIHPVIPERVLTRAPTAELAHDQKDEDSLPPYSELDRLLDAYLNQSKSVDEIVAEGFTREVVERVVKMVTRNEYKRKQAAIGPHIQHKSFGKDWRYPLTNGFKG